MNQRVAITLGSRREQEGRFFRFREPKGVVGAERTNFQGRDRQLEIINRAGGRSEMKNVIDLLGQKEILGHVLFDETIVLVAGEMLDVG